MAQFAAALAAFTALICSPAALADEPSSDTDVQDVVYFGPDRPIFIRLHIQRDGKSFRTFHREFIEGLFRELDDNHDGVLSGTEWDRIPSPDRLLIGDSRGAPQGAVSVRKNIDLDPADGEISPEELSSYLRRVGFGDFSMQFETKTSSSSPNTSDPLFQFLDTDRDGRLSQHELAHAEDIVSKFDTNDDEILTRFEIERPDRPWSPAPGVNAVRRLISGIFLEIVPGPQMDRVVNRLINDLGHVERAGKNELAVNREPLIPIGRLPLPPEQIAPFDSDANGALNQRELRKLLLHGTWAVEVTIRNGKAPAGTSPVDIVVRDCLGSAKVFPLNDGGKSLLLAGTEFLFTPDFTVADSRMRAILDRFRAADRDMNGYVERNEARNNPFFEPAFDSIDANGDRKLFESEVRAYIKAREGAARSRTTLVISQQTNSLFGLLDLNRDGNLGLRELRSASKRAIAWDLDNDGFVTAADIPRQISFTVGPDKPELPSNLPILVARPIPEGASIAVQMGPEWFRLMDRNRDGDVSRREFLGPPTLFERLDRDRDGFISPQEAEAAR
jgi:Ca2+-binding EF-hand superfamily protein